MEKNARITIKGTQKPKNEEAQTVEFITRGKLQRYGAKLRVSYEESDLIGMNGVTTAFEIERGRVSLVRSGKLNTKMEFVEGRRTESMYAMDEGTLLMAVTARRVETDMTDDGGTIYLEYGVELEHSFLGLNTFDIRVQPDETPA